MGSASLLGKKRREEKKLNLRTVESCKVKDTDRMETTRRREILLEVLCLLNLVKLQRNQTISFSMLALSD